MLWIFQEIVSKGKEKMADIEELHEYFVENMKDKRNVIPEDIFRGMD